MKAHMRVRIETGLAAASAMFAVLTAVWKEWIELIFRVDPDGGSGSLELGIVAAALALAVVFAIAARVELKRLRAASAAG